MMRIQTPETLNSLEVLLIDDYMKKHHPNRHYDVRSGNGCVWVTLDRVEMYFIFREGKLVDVQVD